MAVMRMAAIGCGSRARTYVRIAAGMPERFRVVAGADPVPQRVAAVRSLSGEPGFRGFSSAEELLAERPPAEVLLIATGDVLHFRHCVAAMERGYDILLEKPIALSAEEVAALRRRAREQGRRVLVCHVLRYTPFYRKVKEMLDSGELGEIAAVNAVEGIGTWHFAHSYVRGHWAQAEEGTPTLLAKSSHDLDILHWLTGRRCRRVSSFGGLHLFLPRNAPAGAPLRCTDGCPAGEVCQYNALRYIDEKRSWLATVMDGAAEASAEAIRRWLADSPWGRCVYRAGSSAPDRQTVQMEFDGGIAATFTMTAFEEERHIEVFGSEGRLRGGAFAAAAGGTSLHIARHDGPWTGVELPEPPGEDEHGGGDIGLMEDLYWQMSNARPEEMQTSLDASVHSHEIAFAAEKARRLGTVERCDEFRPREAGGA